tara:strand:+ start:12328 stop:14538 length:2211 start_codon:yes stop_codon:yes gene_type:complete
VAKKKRFKNKRSLFKKRKKNKSPLFVLPYETKRKIWGVLMFLLATIITLSYFDLAGKAGIIFLNNFFSLLGGAVFLLPLIFVLGGLAFLFPSLSGLKKHNSPQIFLGIFILILGITGFLGALSPRLVLGGGGWLGNNLGLPVLGFFGFWATEIIFSATIIIGGLIILQLLYSPNLFEKKEAKERPFLKEKQREKPAFLKKIFEPKFTVKEVPSSLEISSNKTFPQKERPLPIPAINNKEKEIFKNYQPPPLDLLESERGSPTAGDIKMNSAIIKKTLQNFDIPVEMSEVNIGPTVTQYTLKPAEGIKLSRILTLSNDLALSLAASSIRIEAPIPGKSLVGIEVPNKVRTLVRLRNSIEHPNFQNSLSNLTFVLGQDVSGRPVFADLARMPHLLVAGSTGTGKTICLSSIILSLLYRNNPDTLKLILVDPKRVDFAVYNNLPHLLTPVIRDAQTTVNVLKWLISEMERRFEVMALAKARNISSYNEKIKIEENSKDPKEESSPQFMPYIVLVIDELADLMVARGREIEASVVRLAQMARAVGIHLIVATQRPSVEVITGLIKANITSRITFQVASQVDSRTVLDMAGAEKLLGLGDMLFISAEIVKPKRIQGTFVLDKEVKRVVKFIIDHQTEVSVTGEEISLGEELSKSIDQTINEGEGKDFFSADDDPLYEEAKRLVIEARKASASLLQRRLRIGYARSARLLDILEERGIVGPGEGAKPREVYVQTKEEEKEEE